MSVVTKYLYDGGSNNALQSTFDKIGDKMFTYRNALVSEVRFGRRSHHNNSLNFGVNPVVGFQ